MGLSSVLVDRGRVIAYTALMQQMPDGSKVPVRVEGTTQMEWVYGQYFDCRVDSPAAPEGEDAAGGRVRTAQRPTLIYSLEDDDGNPVELNADDRVTVESDDLGTATFEVTGEPVLYRKKQDLICGEALLVRVLTFDVADGRVSQLADAATQPLHIATSGS